MTEPEKVHAREPRGASRAHRSNASQNLGLIYLYCAKWYISALCSATRPFPRYADSSRDASRQTGREEQVSAWEILHTPAQTAC